MVKCKIDLTNSRITIDGIEYTYQELKEKSQLSQIELEILKVIERENRRLKGLPVNEFIEIN